jgi:hypothetical protein
MNTCCDHMASDDGFMFCDIGREFPFECKCCAAWMADVDPTQERSQIWHLKVAGPVQAQDFTSMVPAAVLRQAKSAKAERGCRE